MTDLLRGDREAAGGPLSAVGKRERLIDGAGETLHPQGVESPPLADIAHAADVPVGNVYYYFKTKDDLVQAVIAAHADEIKDRLAAVHHHRAPQAPLEAVGRELSA